MCNTILSDTKYGTLTQDPSANEFETGTSTEPSSEDMFANT